MTPPVRTTLTTLLTVLASGAATLALAGPAIAGDGGLSPVTPNAPGAHGITSTYWFITVFIGIVFVVVEGLLVAFVVRYRRKARARDAEGPQIHGASRLELLWTTVPVLILVAIATFVFVKLPGINRVPEASAAGPRLDVTVTGHQFYWEFAYPDGVVTIDRLRVPAGVPVRLTVTAPDWDVIHSWWIPALGGKIDAIPGRLNHTGFTAANAGTYVGRCAELCGIQHTAMLASVHVLPKQAFDAWLNQRERQQAAGTSALGKEEWIGSCAKCHGLAGEGLVGPAIATSPTLLDGAKLAALLQAGKGQMPPVGRGWNGQQLDSLAAYLKGRFGNG
jgi:cytochrome c oxidase subunit II